MRGKYGRQGRTLFIQTAAFIQRDTADDMQRSWSGPFLRIHWLKKNCCFGEKLCLGGTQIPCHKQAFNVNSVHVHAHAHTQTHGWNAALAPRLQSNAECLTNKHNCPSSKGGNTSHFLTVQVCACARAHEFGVDLY